MLRSSSLYSELFLSKKLYMTFCILYKRIWEKDEGLVMIQVKNVSKEFVSPKKYPGLSGAIKGLFSNEKVSKIAVDEDRKSVV